MPTIKVTQTYCSEIAYEDAELVAETDEKFIIKQGKFKIEIHYPKTNFSYEISEKTEETEESYPDYERSFLAEDENEENHSCESVKDSTEYEE